MYRKRQGKLQVLLVHPGGPIWRNKDEGAWSIPKGEVTEREDLLECAKREFEEEIGTKPTGEFVPLTPIRQKSGKIVHAWAVEGDLDTTPVRSNTFEMVWPPKSGKMAAFPEVDRAEFFDLETAKKKVNMAQEPLVVELERMRRDGS
jgi:predicted NUDIX family NTP pyrophosphohydrolase